MSRPRRPRRPAADESLERRLRPPDDVLETEIRGVLRQAGRHGISTDELVAGLVETAHGEQEVREALAALERTGFAVEWSRRLYEPAATDWRVARIERFVGGSAVATAERAAFLVRRPPLKGAKRGDRVLLKPLKANQRRRRPQLPEAAVVRVLERLPDEVVGRVVAADGSGTRLEPYDTKLDLDVDLAGSAEVEEGNWVVAELGARAAGGRRREVRREQRRGRILEVLGPSSEPGVDVAVVLRHYRIPDAFPDAVLAEAAALPADPDAEDWRGRLDLQQESVITIDGEDARDFDDGISVDADEDGWRLGVHIADVSHYVRAGSELDREAYRRGTSVYFPDRAVPMLPESLSNGLCSLRPGVPRLSVSVLLEIDREGEVRRRRIRPSVMRSRRRLTYAEARAILAGEAVGEEGWLIELLDRARDLMDVLRRRRMERGSLDFDLPEGDVVLDTDGVMVGIRPEERHVGHRIIEELMIAANEAVAAEIDDRDAPGLFRVHDAPSAERIAELSETLEALDLEPLPPRRELRPEHFQQALRAVAGRREERLVSTVVLRSLERARYVPELRGHFALASERYSHFTSPIRRYPDLFVHRHLKAALGVECDESRASRAIDLHLPILLPAMAEHLSHAERRAERAERDVLQWKKVRFLASRVGESFAGTITGVQPFGLFVQLDDLFVDGLVPLEEMPAEVEYVERQHELRSIDGGRAWGLGQAVEVELVGVNERVRGLDLTLVARSRRGSEPGRGCRGPRGRGAGRRRRERSR
jgi:ribonuclease R